MRCRWGCARLVYSSTSTCCVFIDTLGRGYSRSDTSETSSTSTYAPNRWYVYVIILPHLIWTGYDHSEHFLLVLIGRSHGKLGHCIQLRWNEVKWDEMRWVKWTPLQSFTPSSKRTFPEILLTIDSSSSTRLISRFWTVAVFFLRARGFDLVLFCTIIFVLSF